MCEYFVNREYGISITSTYKRGREKSEKKKRKKGRERKRERHPSNKHYVKKRQNANILDYKKET